MNTLKTVLKRFFLVLAILIGIIAALAGIEATFNQPMGIFAGKRPQLGFVDGGRLTPCSWKPNCVNSHADVNDKVHFIVPLVHTMDVKSAQQQLAARVVAMPGATITENNEGGYLRAEFKSAKLGFVDDVEFYFQPGSVVQVRSASRLGIRDFDVNRQRIEAIRSKFSPKS